RPGGENRQRHKKSREQNQKQADAIDADDILNAVAWHPWYALDELHFPFAAIELVEDNQRPKKIRDSGDQRQGKKRLRLTAGNQHERQGPHHRDSEQKAQISDG